MLHVHLINVRFILHTADNQVPRSNCISVVRIKERSIYQVQCNKLFLNATSYWVKTLWLKDSASTGPQIQHAEGQVLQVAFQKYTLNIHTLVQHIRIGYIAMQPLPVSLPSVLKQSDLMSRL